jgi:hypothetical protein
LGKFYVVHFGQQPTFEIIHLHLGKLDGYSSRSSAGMRAALFLNVFFLTHTKEKKVFRFTSDPTDPVELYKIVKTRQLEAMDLVEDCLGDLLGRVFTTEVGRLDAPLGNFLDCLHEIGGGCFLS